MINIKELKGNYFKKELDLFKCCFGFHNKNTTGGNFGLLFYFDEEFNPDLDFELYGHYNIKGEIINLKLISIRASRFIISIDKDNLNDLKDLVDYIKKFKKGLILNNLK